MNQLEYVDYTKDWWDKLVIENAEIEGKLFFASSAFDLHAKKRTYMLLYNTNLAAKYKIGNIADLVREGKWTIDKEIEYVKLVSSDLNGDSKMDLEDQFGLVLGDNKDLQYYFVAAGGTIAKKDENGKIQLTINNERTIQLIDKYLELSGKNTPFPQTASNHTTTPMPFSGEGIHCFMTVCLARWRQHPAEHPLTTKLSRCRS